MTGEGDTVVQGFIDALLDDDAEALYDRAPCGYLSTTPDGTIIKANATFIALCGYSRNQLIGRVRFVELLTAGGRLYHETHYSPMLQMHGVAREIALDLVRADGRRLPVLVNAVLERDGAGNPLVVRTAVFDASHRRLYEQELLREKQRAEASEATVRALAQTLQRSLLPPALPKIAGLELAAAFRPAGDGSVVGGDFYDVFQIAEDDWALVIGDVCGKGAEAATVTALARYTLRAAAMQDPAPAHALRLLNAALIHEGTDRFCTVIMMRLTRAAADWRVVLATGGHLLPLLCPDTDGDVEGHKDAVRALGEPGSVLGVLDSVDLPQIDVRLRAGESLILYTDGVTEARAPDGTFFGEEGLSAAVTATTPKTADVLASSLLARVMEFQNGVTRDDIALLVVHVPRQVTSHT